MYAAERQMCNPGVAPPVSGVSFDVIADTYDATRGLPPPLRETAVRAVADAMGRDGLVLEVGVGTGRFAIPLRSLGVRVVGVDIAPRMLAIARGKGCGDLFLASALRLPFRNGAFRASTAIHVLHLVAAWREVLHELARVTRERFVTLFETIETRPAVGGAAWRAPGPGMAYPMSRYQELARPRGYGYEHPGVRPPDLVAKVPPILRAPVGSHTAIVTGEELLAAIAAKTHSSQWHVPEDVHAAIMAELAREVAGARFERTWTVELVAWSSESLSQF